MQNINRCINGKMKKQYEMKTTGVKYAFYFIFAFAIPHKVVREHYLLL